MGGGQATSCTFSHSLPWASTIFNGICYCIFWTNISTNAAVDYHLQKLEVLRSTFGPISAEIWCDKSRTTLKCQLDVAFDLRHGVQSGSASAPDSGTSFRARFSTSATSNALMGTRQGVKRRIERKRPAMVEKGFSSINIQLLTSHSWRLLRKFDP